MVESDKTLRVFALAALLYGVVGIGYSLLIHAIGSWFGGLYFTPISRRAESVLSAENVLSITPWMLVGGLFGLLEHFYKNRKQGVQFGIRFLLLITLLFSLVGAWGTVARSRYQAEQHALAALQQKFGVVGMMRIGYFFPKTTEMTFYQKPTDTDTIPFLISQLRFLPGLGKVRFHETVISKNDLARLRNEFPQVAIVRD